MPNDLKAMTKKVPTWGWLIIAAGGAYLAYRWWRNRSANAGGNAATGGITLGTNLSSVLPNLSAGATGPSSGVAGSSVNETISIQAPSISSNGGARQPGSRAGTPMMSLNGKTPVPLNYGPNMIGQM
jgi:hypothetical protein